MVVGIVQMRKGEPMDLIERQKAIDAVKKNTFRLTFAEEQNCEGHVAWSAEAVYSDVMEGALLELPSAQPEKEIAKRVLWSGWKGTRNTRYKCPMCKKPVKNDDVYCHRCGQKLMFPHISFTDYVPGEKQETIVRWDDE